MIKVLIITQEEPFYIPKLIKSVLGNQNENYKVIGCTVLSPHRKNKTIKDWVLERTKVYTYGELFIVGFLFLYCKLFAKMVFRKNNTYSSKTVFSKYHIPHFETADINSHDYVDRIKALHVDVIVSVSCPQLFKEELFKAAKICCLNAHGTLLPRHRGVFGGWWTLFSGDEIGGASVHTMELRLDAGEIIWQEKFAIEKSETQYSLAYKTKREMSFGLIKSLTDFNSGKPRVIPPSYEESYHRAPTREEGKAFRKKGLRIIALRDVRNILRTSY